MEMTVDEILREYRTSKDKRKAIGIIAELNDEPTWRIRDILENNGIKTGHRRVVRQKRTDFELLDYLDEQIRKNEHYHATLISRYEKVAARIKRGKVRK